MAIPPAVLDFTHTPFVAGRRKISPVAAEVDGRARSTLSAWPSRLLYQALPAGQAASAAK